MRRLAGFAVLLLLAACGVQNDLAEPPVPLGNFKLGVNVAVADNVQMVPISRKATVEEWETAMKKAVDDRFGRYADVGDTFYNIGVSIDGYALAPPGIPVVAAPKSVLAITVTVFIDATQQKLNAEGKQIIVMESLSGDTVIGTGLTRTKEQQMAALTYNAAKKVEEWLLENPEWFGMTAEEVAAAKAARATAAKAPKPKAPATVEPVVAPPGK